MKMYTHCSLILLYLNFATKAAFTTDTTIFIPTTIDDTLALHKKVCSINPICGREFLVDVILDGDHKVDNETFERKRCCGSCSCEEDCYKYGSCCLHLYEGFEYGRVAVESTRYSCVVPEFIVKQPQNYSRPYPYWMIADCEHSTHDGDTIEKCENTAMVTAIDSINPVTDVATGITYKNKFCAQCNGVSDISYLVNWDFKLGCDTAPTLPISNILTQMKEFNCSIVFKPHVNLHVHYCPFSSYYITRCNQTGLWPKYDPLTDAACQAFVDPFNNTYQNYFCYLCNVHIPLNVDELWCSESFRAGHASEDFAFEDFAPPFSAILDLNKLRRWERNDVLNCEQNTQFEDYKLMQCINISCFETYTLEGNNCLLNKTVSERFCHAVFVKLTPDRQMLFPLSVLQDPAFLAQLRHTMCYFVPALEDTWEQFGLFIDFDFVVQEGYVSSFVMYFLLKAELYEDNYLFKQILTMLKVGIEGTSTIGVYFNNIAYWLHAEPSVYNFPGLDVGVVGQFYPSDAVSFDDLLTVSIEEVDQPTCLYKDIAPFTLLKTCPFVSIDFDDIDVYIKNGVLYINETISNFSRWQYESHSGQVHLCLSDYQLVNKQLHPQNISSEFIKLTTVDSKNILALICVCLSLVCLLVTIFTYSHFTELQSQPGINNIILCICLLLAQSMYQFGAGQTSLPGWACTLIGAICHFLWMAAIFSMNACSIHIYLTFSKSRVLSSTFDYKNTFYHIAYIGIASLAFVSLNIIISLIRSQGHNVGYGGNLCYLSSNLNQVLTFLVPLSILLVSNMLLFILVVYKINRAAAVKAKKEKSFLLIYVRLSSLTGITWIVGYLQLLLSHEVFEYLFILFNASQGIFIMIAFVMNKRVYLLFCPTRSSDPDPGDHKTINSKLPVSQN